MKEPSSHCLRSRRGFTDRQYRRHSRATHEAHMQGLLKIMGLCNESGYTVNEGIKRALFWYVTLEALLDLKFELLIVCRLDLMGAVVCNSARLFSHDTFPELSWTRDPFECMYLVPAGFKANLNVLDDRLVPILEDVYALQILLECPDFRPAIYEIDNAQAWLESRLYNLQDAMPSCSHVGRCCCLAAYIASYCLFAEVWNSHLIPGHVSTQLGQLLFHTERAPDVWDNHLGLLLWILFMGGPYAKLESSKKNFIKILRWALAQLQHACSRWEDTESILQTFIWSRHAFLKPCRDLWLEACGPAKD